MQKHLNFIGGCVLAVSLPLLAAPVPPETVLISDGPIKVDAADFEGNILRIPENRRGDFRTSYDRVAAVVDNIFVNRALAAKAREAGLDQDPAIQRRMTQLQDSVLADLYLRRIEREVAAVDLEPRARELFKADQARFVAPEQVYVQMILVGLTGRTREAALERARKVYEEARAGKEDFLALAARYSDDPQQNKHGGDYGYNGKDSFPAPVAKAIAAMSVKGEVAGPVESERGFHVVRFIDRKKEQPMKFEAVRKGLIEAEREKLNKKRVDAVMQSVRESPTVTVHPENVEKLVIPVDVSKVKQAAEAPASR